MSGRACDLDDPTSWVASMQLGALLARTEHDPTTGCLLWTGATNAYGYGKVTRDGRTLGAHRLALALTLHPESALLDDPTEALGAGIEACHSCDTPACVNPAHLWAGTRLDNALDAVAKGRTNPGPVFLAAAAARLALTHCPQGHPYEGANLYVTPDGRRACRTCRRAAGRRYWARKGGAR